MLSQPSPARTVASVPACAAGAVRDVTAGVGSATVGPAGWHPHCPRTCSGLRPAAQPGRSPTLSITHAAAAVPASDEGSAVSGCAVAAVTGKDGRIRAAMCDWRGA